MIKLLLPVIFCVTSLGSFADCNRKAANMVQTNVASLAKFSRQGSYTEVRWGNTFHQWSKDQQLQMAQAVANADACLSGSANEFRFYSPAGKLNAVASPTSGIRLID